MSDGISFHPDDEILERFCRGQLSIGLSVAVSAHLELCPRCSRIVEDLERSHCHDWVTDETTGIEFDGHDTLISNIVSQPQQFTAETEVQPLTAMHLPDSSVTLPRALSSAAAGGLVWKKLAGGINQASLDLDPETQCEFLYMKPGSQTPMHKHQGFEVTLVLDGVFSDEMGSYGDGDFILRSGEDVHQPKSDEGCLCFAVLDSPLTFTQGLARLFNPINRLRFNRAISRSGS